MVKTKVTDFKKNEFYGRTIEETGRWTYNSQKGCYVGEINWSSIITKLIQEAGRWCVYYASDLFVQLHPIVNALENGTLRSRNEIFGFRESGVDHDSFILSRYKTQNESCIASYYYRSIWRLDIECETDEYGNIFNGASIKFALYECDR